MDTFFGEVTVQVHFSIVFTIFFSLIYKMSLSNLEMTIFLVIYIATILSYPSACLFILLRASFDEEKLSFIVVKFFNNFLYG